MFAEINEKDVIASIESFKTKPFPPSRQGIFYSIWYDGINYPIKETIDRHYELRSEINPHPNFNTDDAQTRLLELGFPIIENLLSTSTDFFSKKDLITFEKLVERERYDSTNPIDHNIAKYLNRISWGKTKQWSYSLINSKWDIEGKKHWNSMHKIKKQIYKEYTWYRIIPKDSKNRLIYFTIGIDRFQNKQLLLKLDFQRENPFFNNEKKMQFDKLRTDLGIEHKCFKMDDLVNYNWEKLTEESLWFIEGNIENYHKIVSEIGSIKTIKAARICWNTKGWRQPSGREGKSLNNSFESSYGFGNEEWLFDLSKTYEGCCYARLEPINKSRNKLKGKQIDLMLFTLEQGSPAMQWIAKISNVAVVSEEESERVCESEEAKLWKLERLNQLQLLDDVFPEQYNSMPNTDLYNIRFKPEDVEIFGEKLDVAVDLIKLKRYILNDFDSRLEKEVRSKSQSEDFEPQVEDNPSEPLAPTKKIKRTFSAGTVEHDNIHRDIQNALVKYLRNRHLGARVGYESNREMDKRRVDVVMEHQGKKIYFEVKSYPELYISIRAAVGQLIEYCFFCDANRAERLVIVSHLNSSESIDKFMGHLRKSLGLNIYYHQLNLKDGDLKGWDVD